MADFSALFAEKNLIDRMWFLDFGTWPGIIVPAGANILRAHGVGGGGQSNGGDVYSAQVGGGAAFARVTTACTPGEALSVQVGERGQSSAAGDTIVTRTTGAVVLLKAVRGAPGAAGLAANCVGDVKRSGLGPVPFTQRGTLRHSGHDLDDQYSLGFGGRAAGYQVGASNGGGGAVNVAYPGTQGDFYCYPGHGKACLEFFSEDPGYGP